jgi:hypothetical protein
MMADVSSKASLTDKRTPWFCDDLEPSFAFVNPGFNSAAPPTVNDSPNDFLAKSSNLVLVDDGNCENGTARLDGLFTSFCGAVALSLENGPSPTKLL